MKNYKRYISEILNEKIQHIKIKDVLKDLQENEFTITKFITIGTFMIFHEIKFKIGSKNYMITKIVDESVDIYSFDDENFGKDDFNCKKIFDILTSDESIKNYILNNTEKIKEILPFLSDEFKEKYKYLISSIDFGMLD